MPKVVEQDTEFFLAEYRQSANAYRQGVNIGWIGLRFYITINAFLATAFGILTGFKEQQLVPAGYVVKLSPIFALVLCIFALLLSFAILFVLRHYFDHLENCRKRCQQIETKWGGQLFTSMKRIEDRSSFHATHVVSIIVGCVAAIWGIAIYYLLVVPEVFNR